MKKIMKKSIQANDMKIRSICALTLLITFFFSIGIASAADPSLVQVNPATQSISAGSSFNITINCIPGQPVKAFELKLSFNPSLVRVNSVSEGDFFTGYTTFFNPGVIDNGAGTVINVYNLIVGPGNVTGSGSLISLNLTARSTSGTSPLTLYEVRLTNESGYLPISVLSGSVVVTGGSSPPPPGGGENPPVSNTPPAVPLQPVGPAFAEIGTPYSYSSTTFDPEGDLLRLRFDWGDGTLSNWTSLVASNTSVSMIHTWMNISNYTVRVIAQDALGANSSWSEPLTVVISQIIMEEYPPVALFDLPVNASANRIVVFDASESYDPDGLIVLYHWDFGDGSTGTDAILSHVYQTPGAYTVTLTVTDNAGMTATNSQILTVAVSQGSTGENGLGFFTDLPPEHILLILAAIVGSVLCALFFYRYKTSEKTLLKQIKQSNRIPSSHDSRKPSLPTHVEHHNNLSAPMHAAQASLPTPLTRPKIDAAQIDAEIASLQKRIEEQKIKRKTVEPQMATAEIDQIITDIFNEMQRHGQTPRTDKVLQAYNIRIAHEMEMNPSLTQPMVDIETVKEIIERRVHAIIAEKIDKM